MSNYSSAFRKMMAPHTQVPWGGTALRPQNKGGQGKSKGRVLQACPQNLEHTAECETGCQILAVWEGGMPGPLSPAELDTVMPVFV